jgi:hypothetical protein
LTPVLGPVEVRGLVEVRSVKLTPVLVTGGHRLKLTIVLGPAAIACSAARNGGGRG